jgi:hypothetical protein
VYIPWLWCASHSVVSISTLANFFFLSVCRNFVQLKYFLSACICSALLGEWLGFTNDTSGSTVIWVMKKFALVKSTTQE